MAPIEDGPFSCPEPMTDYCSVATLKAAIQKTGAGDDAVLALLVTAASRAIDRFCNRPDNFFVAGGTASARLFSGSGDGVLWIDPAAVAPTLVEAKDSPSDSTFASWAATDWTAASGDPDDPDFNTTPYELLLIAPGGSYSHFPSGAASRMRGFRPDTDRDARRTGAPVIRVTARWGYATAVPAQIEQACLTLAARWYKRGQSAWADTVAGGDMGSLQYRKALDPDVQMMLALGRFKKPAIGAR